MAILPRSRKSWERRIHLSGRCVYMVNLDISTDDPEDARRKVSEIYCDHGLRVVNSRNPFHLQHVGTKVDDIGVYLMSYGAYVEVRPDVMEDFALVQIPLQGRALDRIDGEAIETTSKLGSVTSPGQDLEMTWAPGASKLVLYIPKVRIHDAARALAGQQEVERIKLRPIVDLSEPAHRSWYGVVRSLADDVRHGGPMASNPLLSARIADAVILGLVSNQSEQPLAAVAGSGDGLDGIDLAVRLLERNPEEAWRMSDLARQVQLTPRKLSTEFRERTGMLPMEFLQFIRLHRVHQDLRASLPSSTSVTEVALRWGFNHLGRFAARYQERFDELPSETLRR